MSNSVNNFSTTNFIVAKQVAKEVGICLSTLNRWYAWYNDESCQKPDDCPTLPKYYVFSKKKNGRNTRYWIPESVEEIKIFKEYVDAIPNKSGIMKDFARKHRI